MDFQPVHGGAGDAARLDALVVFDAPDDPDPVARPARQMTFLTAESHSRAPSAIMFSSSLRLDRRLRRRTLPEHAMHEFALSAARGDEILATAGGRPVWFSRGSTDRSQHLVAGGPDELRPGEYLRDHASPGRFMGLVPLIHFLREVTADAAWAPPATRAAFVVDDPNLHWRSYGYLKYPELVVHARELAYHIVMAMVPLDAWFADPRAVRLFRESRDVLSLCFHGNDHRRHDLARPTTREHALQTLSSAVCRIVAFEQRTKLDVSRVMVPPHEACSPATMNAMADVGFEAACATRPYLWMDFGVPPTPYTSPLPDDLLSGWHMTHLMENGFPVMLRREFHELDDAVLRSFFNQPIVLYGHASDFAQGLHPLEEAATLINSLPEVEWKPLADIAETNFETRRSGTTLRLRPFARRVRVAVDPDVSEIVLEPPGWVGGFTHGVEATVDQGHARVEENTVELSPVRTGSVEVEIHWKPAQEVVRSSIPRRSGDARAVLRRILAEARDRIQPLR